MENCSHHKTHTLRIALRKRRQQIQSIEGEAVYCREAGTKDKRNVRSKIKTKNAESGMTQDPLRTSLLGQDI